LESSEQAEKLRALELQLESMEQLFALQEQVLGKSGYQAGQQALLDSTSQHPPSSDLDTLPFVRLLQAMRQELMRSKMGALELERRLEESTKECSRLRAGLCDAETESTAHSLLLGERTASLTRKLEALRAQLAAAEEGLGEARIQARRADARSSRSEGEVRSLRTTIESARDRFDANILGSTVGFMQHVQSLRAMEERLQHAARRVAFASSIVAQKEVVLRNSLAAIESERRTMQAVVVTGSLPGGAGGALLSTLQLQPEAEGILCSLFRGLDTDDSGKVVGSLLLTVLVGDGCSEGASSKEEVFGDSLGAGQWARLLAGLRALGAEAELTWGEFLLLLLPPADPALQRAVALSAAEMEGLRRAGLLGDGDWGAAALLRVDMSAQPQADPASPSSSREVAVLHAERAYLLVRLQSMGRTLERRAEGIKAYFEGELSKMRLREGRAQQQTRELRDAYSVLEARLAEAEMAWRAEKERLEGRSAVLETECSQLRVSLDSRLGGELARHEAAAAEERSRYSRLETEHLLLQREHSKRDVRLKGLQRDVVRLQAAVAAAGTDRAALERRAEDEAAAARELRQSSSDMTIRLLEGEKELALLQAHLVELEGRLRVSEAASRDSAAAAAVFAAAAATTAEPPPAAESSAQALRSQMDVLRAMPREAAASHADVYTAHLTKLLRLAEEAINKS